MDFDWATRLLAWARAAREERLKTLDEAAVAAPLSEERRAE